MQPALNSVLVKALPLPVAPLQEMRQIVEGISERDSIIIELEKTVNLNLQRAERLRQAILKKAFRGELVPQDPNDEPATALLARIQAARQGGKQPQQIRLL
jgi:type I restriction enzyme S subunit